MVHLKLVSAEHIEYRRLYYKKAKVAFVCGGCNAKEYGVLCPLPIFLKPTEIANTSHVCMSGFKRRGII